MGAALLVSLLLVALFAPASAFAQSGGPTPVHVDPVRAVPLAQTAPVIGRLVATRAGPIAAKVEGPVDSFVMEVGDRVARGSIIALLDDEMLAARRDQAAAALKEARARHQTRAERLTLAKQELDRLTRLRGSAAFSEANFNDRRQEVAIARAEAASAQAEIASAQADLRVADIDLKHAEILAPYGGVITERAVESGAYVARGGTVARLVSDQSLEVEADVPFQRLDGLREGARVTARLGNGRSFEAKVRAILPRENPLTRTRTVRFVPTFATETEAEAKAGGYRYAAGESATLDIPAGQTREVLSVHKDAVIRRGNEAMVYVHVDGEAQVRPVQLGAELGARFEVLDGLSDGALAVVRGNERLRPGQAITIDQRLKPETRAPEAGPEGAPEGAPEGEAG